MDYENGSRWQELDADNKVTTKVWDGKQDIYHLLHCPVIPRIPLAPVWHRLLPQACWTLTRNN